MNEEPKMNEIMPPLTLFEDQLRIGKREIIELASSYGTPTYITDEQRVRRNCRRLIAAFGKNYQKFRLNYAVKANNNLAILNIVRQEGAGADCSCIEEIALARLAGFRGEQLLYSSNYNSDHELAQGIESAAAINLDDAALLPRLLEHGKPETLSFRVNPGMGKGQYPGLVFGGENTKFGVGESEIVQAYTRAKESGIRKFGIHMMTGSNVLNLDYFVSVTRKLFEIAEKIAREVGITFEFVDIGGGFGVPYRPEESPLDIELLGSNVGGLFKEFVETKGIGDPYLMIEPGRFVICDSTVLVGRVHHIKKAGARTFVGTDIGMNTILRPALYGAYHHVYVANRPLAKANSVVTLTGKVCENTDVLAKDRTLPHLELGDIIVVMNAGAYGYAMSNQYNSRPRAAEVLVNEAQTDTIRERETVIDLINRQRVPMRLLR
ncbi:MAG TPA: diaminopimelate decarboxylase [Candidatus Bathyarchaeia archaeon]|nr:diaminopimelate decarboxylase [Candidatus Bathyarchaeia archaeon]